MSSLKTFDCIVVGGGPAGSMTAYTLVRSGISVGILEAREIYAGPGPKACGGGVQIKAIRLLPFDVREVVEREIYGMVFKRRLGNRFTRRCSSPITYNVNRARFDTLLLEHAQQKGAILLPGERALSVEPAADEAGLTRIITGRNVYNARVVVGADGAGSIVRRAVNPAGISRVQLGVICELDKDGSTGHIPEDLFTIDWGTVPGGYAWIFPKEKTLTVGAMVPRELVRTVNTYLRVFLDKEGLRIPRGGRVRAHPIPTRGPGEPIASGWGILVGDAAGLTDPFTGEGIYYAIKSGQIAARYVERYLGENGEGSLTDYEKEIDEGLMQEIIVAGKMRSFFNTFSRYIHGLYRRNDRLWYAFCEAMRGDRTLAGLRRIRTIPPKPVREYLEKFTAWYEGRQIDRFRESDLFM